MYITGIQRGGLVDVYKSIKTHFNISTRFLTDYHGCIIGSGPSGLYLVQDLLKKSNQHNIRLHLDIYDKLSTPYGLVRYGVAPDHQDVKKVESSFEKILMTPNVLLLGGVDVGKDVLLDELMENYDFNVLCYGQFNPKLMNIEGENFGNIFTGQSFVCWYNGHPCSLNMKIPNLKVKNAVVIGLGNVAIDVARLLLTDFNDPNHAYDIPEPALERLREKQIENVFIVGRGGVDRIAFTIKEFRELTNKPNVAMKLDAKYFEHLLIEDFPKNRQRLLKLIKDVSSKSNHDTTTKNKDDLSCSVLFEKVPQNFLNDINQNVQSMHFKDKKTGENLTIDCGLVVTCIGYNGLSIDPKRITFDPQKSCIPNIDARIISSIDHQIIPGLYCNGWIKTGPQGTIASTLMDTYRTSDTIMSDILSGKLEKPQNNPQNVAYGNQAIVKLLNKRGIQPKSLDDWKLINEQEKQIGEVKKKIREKIIDETLIENLVKK